MLNDGVKPHSLPLSHHANDNAPARGNGKVDHGDLFFLDLEEKFSHVWLSTCHFAIRNGVCLMSKSVRCLRCAAMDDTCRRRKRKTPSAPHVMVLVVSRGF